MESVTGSEDVTLGAPVAPEPHTSHDAAADRLEKCGGLGADELMRVALVSSLRIEQQQSAQAAELPGPDACEGSLPEAAQCRPGVQDDRRKLSDEERSAVAAHAKKLRPSSTQEDVDSIAQSSSVSRTFPELRRAMNFSFC